MDIFDFEEWKEKIKKPTWYFDVPKEMKKLQELKEQDEKAYEQTKEQVYQFFEKALTEKAICLGEDGKDFDAERKPIDTIVVHHTHNPPGISPERLSAMTLLRLYASEYANPTHEGDKEIQGEPIYSGHFQGEKQVFYPYHWIVRTDGKTERLLSDNEIGWHAGSWEVNCRSVAIVLDNDYENSEPSSSELQAIVDVVKKNYPDVSMDKVVGHREINQKTTCPSNLFLGEGGWKEKLLTLLK